MADYKKIFIAENRYTTGMIFMFATLIGFFTHMRKIEFAVHEMIGVLVVLCVLAYFVSAL